MPHSAGAASTAPATAGRASTVGCKARPLCTASRAAPTAAAGANSLRSVGQMAGLLNVLAIFGVGWPLKSLQVNTQENDATFVAEVDAQSLTQLLAQLI